MSTALYVDVKNLPECIQAALLAVGYHKPNIQLTAAEHVHSPAAAFEGSRAFICGVDLATGQRTTGYGSWGGPNPFPSSAANPVDSHAVKGTRIKITPNYCVISGESGGRGCFATLYVRPESMAPLLPATPEVDPMVAMACAIVKGLKSHARRECFARNGITEAHIDAAIAAGLLSRNKAGAVAITTAGKNAAASAKRFQF